MNKKYALLLALCAVIVLGLYFSYHGTFQEPIASQTPLSSPTPIPTPTMSHTPAPSVTPKISSGIHGTVYLGPTCPVQKFPPEPECADKPYPTSVEIFHNGQDKPFITIKTDQNAYFEITLPPDIYVLQPIGGNPLPRCANLGVIVSAGKYENAQLWCDTGIR